MPSDRQQFDKWFNGEYANLVDQFDHLGWIGVSQKSFLAGLHRGKSMVRQSIRKAKKGKVNHAKP